MLRQSAFFKPIQSQKASKDIAAEMPDLSPPDADLITANSIHSGSAAADLVVRESR
jgi:hypothetical protein